jgi:BMFP domain-containing protein YqiC
MQTANPLLDGLAKLFTDAAGAAQGARTEFEGFVKQRLEKLVSDMDFVPREEFEAVKAMAAKARAENQRLEARLAALERRATPKKRRIQPRPRAHRKL